MTERKEGLGIFLGISLLLALHFLGFLIVLFGGSAIGGALVEQHLGGSVVGTPYEGWGIALFYFAITGVSVYQLLYVIPLVLLFKRQGNIGMMKGMIMGASLTALFTGPCFAIGVAGFLSR